MSKKIIIASIVLTLIMFVGSGVWFVISRRPQGTSQRLAALNHEQEAKEPVTKLAYIGTNETLSEAQYNLDLQDGKLDEPHIVHKILEMDPKSEISDIKRQALLFIGKDGKMKKEEIFESKPSKVDIYITQNGKYAMVLSNFTSTGITYRYYDIKGDLLWMKENTQNSYKISPDGGTVIEKVYDQEKKQYFYNLLDSKNKLIKERFFAIELSGYYPEEEVLFSPNAIYFALRYSNVGNKSLFMLFDKNGNILYSRRITGFVIENQEDKLSDEGNYRYVGYDLNTFRKKISIYDKGGKEEHPKILLKQ